MLKYIAIWVLAAASDNILVTPHLEVAVTVDRNIVYCSTFQIAWDDMKSNIIGEDIRLEKPLELVRRLNEGTRFRTALTAGLPEAKYLAVAGANANETVREINRELEIKFGTRMPAIEERYGECVIAYACLVQTLEFERPFEEYTNQNVIDTGGERAGVEAFGIYDYAAGRHAGMAGQAEILRYQEPRDFIVRLKCADPEDEIIIAKMAPGGSLADMVAAVRSRVEDADPLAWGRGDVLVIPKLRAAISHSFEEVDHLYLRNEGWEEFYVHAMKQDVRFLLDESGVLVESSMELAFKQKGPPAAARRMVCHAPFLFCLQRKSGEHPYFVMWVADEELMVPSG